jgi:hypothetical protein
MIDSVRIQGTREKLRSMVCADCSLEMEEGLSVKDQVLALCQICACICVIPLLIPFHSRLVLIMKAFIKCYKVKLFLVKGMSLVDFGFCTDKR